MNKNLIALVLPSRDELDELYLNRAVVGEFDSNTYWSSTEEDSRSACGRAFSDGDSYCEDKDGASGVRAVRAF